MNVLAQRLAGACLHITSLPGAYGIGELGAAARDFIGTLARMQLRVWQVLPTGPTGYGNSPYQALSAFAGNELLLDISELVHLGLLHAHEADALRQLPSAAVDYGALIPLKSALLRLAASRFATTANSRVKGEYDAFLERHDAHWLHDYACFRVLKSRYREQAWMQWDAPLREHDSRMLRRLDADATENLHNIKVLQFLFHQQWADLRRYAHEHKVLLFGDLPIYLALDSVDAWSRRDLLQWDKSGKPARVAGVPPDYFSADGQLWGNPLYDWDRHRDEGYAWWRQRLAHAHSQLDLIRLDHFRAFESYWSVPAEAINARDGSWEQGPGDDFFNAIRSGLGELPLVAEDLGIITPAVDSLRRRHKLPGMRVLQFELLADDFDADGVPVDSVCYTGTHDNDTTLGWFRSLQQGSAEGRALQAQVLERTQGSAKTIHHDMIRLALGSDACLAVAPLQDCLGLGSEARLNHPGTSSGNWNWRLGPAAVGAALTDQVADWVQQSDRCRQ